MYSRHRRHSFNKLRQYNTRQVNNDLWSKDLLTTPVKQLNTEVLLVAHALLVYDFNPAILWGLVKHTIKMKAVVLEQDMQMGQENKYSLAHLLYAYSRIVGGGVVTDEKVYHEVIEHFDNYRYYMFNNPNLHTLWQKLNGLPTTILYVYWSCINSFDLTQLWQALPHHVYAHRRVTRIYVEPTFGSLILLSATDARNVWPKNEELACQHMDTLNECVKNVRQEDDSDSDDDSDEDSDEDGEDHVPHRHRNLRDALLSPWPPQPQAYPLPLFMPQPQRPVPPPDMPFFPPNQYMHAPPPFMPLYPENEESAPVTIMRILAKILYTNKSFKDIGTKSFPSLIKKGAMQYETSHVLAEWMKKAQAQPLEQLRKLRVAAEADFKNDELLNQAEVQFIAACKPFELTLKTMTLEEIEKIEIISRLNVLTALTGEKTVDRLVRYLKTLASPPTAAASSSSATTTTPKAENPDGAPSGLAAHPVRGGWVYLKSRKNTKNVTFKPDQEEEPAVAAPSGVKTEPVPPSVVQQSIIQQLQQQQQQPIVQQQATPSNPKPTEQATLDSTVVVPIINPNDHHHDHTCPSAHYEH